MTVSPASPATSRRLRARTRSTTRPTRPAIRCQRWIIAYSSMSVVCGRSVGCDGNLVTLDGDGGHVDRRRQRQRDQARAAAELPYLQVALGRVEQRVEHTLADPDVA